MTSANEKLEPQSQSELSQAEVIDSPEKNSNEVGLILAKDDSTGIASNKATILHCMLSTSGSRPALVHWIAPVLVGYLACAISSIFSLIGRLVQHLYPAGSITFNALQDFVLVNLHSSFHISVSILMHGPVLALVLINLWALRRSSSRSKPSEFAIVMVILFFATVLQLFIAFNWNPQAFGWVYFLRTILKDYVLIAPPALLALFARELLIMKASNLPPIEFSDITRKKSPEN